MSKNIIELNADNFESEIKNGVTLVDFWAEWCGPCKMLTPVIHELADDFAGKAKVAKLNVDECGEIAMKFGIMSIPTIIIFKDGQPAEKSIGAAPKETLAELINNHL